MARGVKDAFREADNTIAAWLDAYREGRLGYVPEASLHQVLKSAARQLRRPKDTPARALPTNDNNEGGTT